VLIIQPVAGFREEPACGEEMAIQNDCPGSEPHASQQTVIIYQF